MKKVLVTCIQMSSSEQKLQNLHRAQELIHAACKVQPSSDLPHLVCLPELFNFRSNDKRLAQEMAEQIPLGPSSIWASKLAKEMGVYLVAGSILELSPNPAKPYNTSAVFDPKGELVGFYRKQNLFQFTSPESRLELNEPDHRSAGREFFTFSFGDFTVGLGICFDLRFPAFFGQLAKSGVNLFVLPSAFTYRTGSAHWEILVRARAIETQSYFVAPNQTAETDCWGESLIVGPWGEILAKGSNAEDGFFTQVLDLSEVERVRASLPLLASS